ncbi:Dual oxidase maturation factor [Trinorchestia longiramus]|nr:Dual oxidase maturation factor [Trinorchestia longiramus]
MVVKHGSFMLLLTGACLTTAAILWATVRNPIELAVPFDPPNGILTTKYGYHWYLALIVGIVCMLSGLLLLILNYWNHDLACKLLDINPNAYVEEEYGECAGLENKAATESSENLDIEMAEAAKPPVPASLAVRYRSRGTSRKNWKTHQIPSSPSPSSYPPPRPTEIPSYDDVAPSHLPPPPPTGYPQIQITAQPPTPDAGVDEEPLYGNVLPQQTAPHAYGQYTNVPQHPAPPPPPRSQH